MRTSSRRLKISAVLIGAVMLLVPATSAVADADLAVTKTGPAAVVAGANLTYTITVTNGLTESALAATLLDDMPVGTTFVSLTHPSATWACTAPAVGGTGQISCTNPSVSAADEFTLVVNVDPGTADGTVITNTATVSSETADPVSTNNSATATTTVGLVADLCTITGTNGPDDLMGTTGDDVICGGNGHDTIDGLAGNDVIVGGNGKDVLVGGEGNDTLMGRNGNDEITGDAGVDVLLGGNGKDHLDGEDLAPGDALDGGRGKDDCEVDAGYVTTACP